MAAKLFEDTSTGVLANLSFLMIKEENEWNELVPVKEHPDMGKAPDSKDTTCTNSPAETSIPGIEKNDTLKYTGNYTAAQRKRLNEVQAKGDCKFALWIGGTVADDGTVTPTGSQGVFEFSGALRWFLKGYKSDDVMETEIDIYPSSKIVNMDAPTTTTGA